MGKINIGVTGTGSLIGQAIIKSVMHSDLNQKIDFIGFDYFKNTVGSFWCKKNYLLPDILNPQITEQQWLDIIINTIKENDIKLLFVGVDFELPLLAKHRKFVEEQTGAVVLVSSEDVINIADDKYLTYQFLKQNNLHHPKSWLPTEIETTQLSFPLITKPRKGARSVGVSKVENKEQLDKNILSLKDPIIQECVGTEESEYTCGAIYLDNEVKKVIILNRSLKAGNTYISHYKNDFPEIISEYVTDVCIRLKPFGSCNFQLRIDENGLPKIFEINSRHSGTTYIRSLFGFKEVEYIINYLLFNKEQEFELKEGTVVRYYDEFFIAKTK